MEVRRGTYGEIYEPQGQMCASESQWMHIHKVQHSLIRCQPLLSLPLLKTEMMRSVLEVVDSRQKSTMDSCERRGTSETLLLASFWHGVERLL